MTLNASVYIYTTDTQLISVLVDGCLFDQSNGLGSYTGAPPQGVSLYENSVPGYWPNYDVGARDVPALRLAGNVVANIVSNTFRPFSSSPSVGTLSESGPSPNFNWSTDWFTDPPVPYFASNQPMIEATDLTSTAGPQIALTATGNQFTSNTDDTRLPASGNGFSYSTVDDPGNPWDNPITGAFDVAIAEGNNNDSTVRNQWLLEIIVSQLRAVRLSDNAGDGSTIVDDPTLAFPGCLLCDMNLEKSGSVYLWGGATELPLWFGYTEPWCLPGLWPVPGPAVGYYVISASFSWDCGRWWVDEASPMGFLLKWKQPPPPASTPPLVLFSVQTVNPPTVQAAFTLTATLNVATK